MAKKWSKDIRIYFGGYDPGTHTTRHAVGLVVNPLDPTSYGDAAERVLAGERADTFEWAGWFENSDADGLDKAASVLLGSATNNVISVTYGSATGDLTYVGTGYLLAEQGVARIGELGRMEAEFEPDQKWGVGAHYGLHVSLDDGTVTGSIDGGGTTTAGGAFYVHAFSIGASGSVSLQQSPDGTTFADHTVINVGTGVSAHKSAFTSILQQYTQVYMATGSGTITAVSVRENA